eukprot:5688804-Pyramimonas_sp.AAC.1
MGWPDVLQLHANKLRHGTLAAPTRMNWHTMRWKGAATSFASMTISNRTRQTSHIAEDAGLAV